jgi:hypothetical protein
MADEIRIALDHAMRRLRLISDIADPDDILADPEEYGGTDDGPETLSMVCENMKSLAAMALEDLTQIAQAIELAKQGEA